MRLQLIQEARTRSLLLCSHPSELDLINVQRGPLEDLWVKIPTNQSTVSHWIRTNERARLCKPQSELNLINGTGEK